jgi:hypothetical protein
MKPTVMPSCFDTLPVADTLTEAELEVILTDWLRAWASSAERRRKLPWAGRPVWSAVVLALREVRKSRISSLAVASGHGRVKQHHVRSK